jgi:hypothetical protein
MRPLASRRSILVVCTAAFVLTVGGARASAQGVGFQGGVSIDPEQVYAGTHVELGPIVDRLFIRPGVEGGIGDGLSLAAVNIELIYKFELSGSRWSIYQGGGPSVNIYRVNDATDVGGGVSYVFGFGHEHGFFAEFKVGSNSSPGIKFGAGYTVR